MHLKSYINILFLYLLSITFGCSDDEITQKNEIGTAVYNKNYNFPFQLINLLENPVQIIENETLLSLRLGNRINLYDIESGNLIDSIILDNPAFNNIHHIFLLDRNRLALFNKYNNQIKLVDKDFNLLMMGEFPSLLISEDSIMSYHLNKSVSVKPDKLTNGLIGIKIEPHFNFDVSSSEYYFYLLKKYNVHSNAIISFEPFNVALIGHFPEEYYEKPRQWNGIEYASTLRIIDSLSCIQCLSLENTCYIHHLKDNTFTKLNFQSNFTSMPPKPSSMYPSYDKSQFAQSIQMFKSLHINQRTKKIYRIVQHELPIKDENGNYYMHGDNNWSIVEYDLNFKRFKEYYFEGKYYAYGNILPFKDGLLISNQGVKNKHYDSKKQSYSYFTFE